MKALDGVDFLALSARARAAPSVASSDIGYVPARSTRSDENIVASLAQLLQKRKLKLIVARPIHD
jgi:hypothetical protein